MLLKQNMTRQIVYFATVLPAFRNVAPKVDYSVYNIEFVRKDDCCALRH